MTMQTQHFCYAARASSGAAVRGRIDANSVDAVLAHLTARGLTAVDVRPAHRLSRMLRTAANHDRKAAVLLFLRSFAIVLGVGIPLRRALSIAAEESRHAGFREALASVLSSVESGATLARALRSRPDFFSFMTVALVEAGERSGRLTETLERHAMLLERGDKLKRKLVATFTSPAIVLCTALALVVVLISSILPTFADLFRQLRVDPPWTMQVLLQGANLLAPQNLLLSGGILAAAALAAAWLPRRFPTLAEHLETIRLRLPVIGSLLKKSTHARISRTLATLISSGIPISESIDIVRQVAGMHVYVQGLHATAEALRDGASIADALRAAQRFDGMLLHLVAVGEETGTVDAQLLRAAEYYETMFEDEATRAATLVEPLLIAGIGTIVGFVVFSIFVPLYGLVGNIK